MTFDNIQKDRLWMKGFAKNLSDDEIYEYCERISKMKILHMSRPPTQTYVFLTYRSDEDARQALLNIRAERLQVNYARKKKTTSGTSSTVESSSQQNSSSNSNVQLSSSGSTANNRRVHFSNQAANPSSSQPANNDTGVMTNGNTAVPEKSIYQNGEEVIITHVINASLFYARPVSQNQRYKELLKTISQIGKTAESLQDIPDKCMVLAPYKNQFYRGLTSNQSVEPDTNLVVVRLVDIGLTIKVPSCQLKSTPIQFTTVRITYPFQLDGVEDDGENSYAANCLKSYTEKTLKMEFDGQVQPRSKVRLIDPSTKLSINEIIKDLKLSFNANKLIRNPAPISSNELLVIIDESKLRDGFNLLTFVDMKNSKQMNQQRERIQTFGKLVEHYPPHTPNLDELCITKFNGLWYRGIFVKWNVVQKKALILLIDIATAVEIDSKDVRRIATGLAEMPVVSFIAAIAGFGQKIDKSKVDEIIHKFKTNNKICVKSIRESGDKGIYTVEV